MHFLRCFGGPVTPVISLIFLSVIVVVSIGEGFKVFLVRRDGIKIGERDGSKITFSMPWKPALAASKPESKDLSSDMDNLMGDIANVASAIFGDGSKIESKVVSEGAGLESTPLSTVSSVSDCVTTSASSMQDVSGQIQQATNIVEGVVEDVTSIVDSILAAATNASNIGVLPYVNSTSSIPGIVSSSQRISVPPTMSEPQEFLPQTAHCSTCNSSHSVSPHNSTSIPALSPSQTMVFATTETSCTSKTASCPAPITETCTVTEIWHSTHYANTATYYTFIANYTVTCTETVGICPTSNVHLPQANAIIPPLPALIACADGVLVKRQEDCLSTLNASYPLNVSIAATYSASSPISTHPCSGSGYSCSECPEGWFCPPPQTPAQYCICGYGWACANCKDGFFCIPGPTSGLLNTVPSLLATILASSSIPSAMASLTVSPLSLSNLLPLGSILPVGIGPIRCDDGSIVMMRQDCLDGVSYVSDMTGTVTANTVDLTMINLAMNAVSAAPTGISDLARGLPSNANIRVSSVPSNVQPAAAAGVVNTAENLLSLVAVNVNTAGSNVPTATAFGNLPSQTLPGNAIDAANPAVNVVSQLSTIINSQSTVLPIDLTITNGNPTARPVMNTIMNGAHTTLQVPNASTDQLAQALGLSKGRRRGLKRREDS